MLETKKPPASARIIDGKQIAQRLREAIATEVQSMEIPPALAVLMVGDDPASAVYVRNKTRFAKQVGIRSSHQHLPKDVSQAQLHETLHALANDDTIDGILLQLPLPKTLDTYAALACIPPEKDVDGLTEMSAGRLILGCSGLRPCTPQGCLILAQETLGQDLSGLHCVVIGRSILVGKPVAQIFLQADCTVSMAHSRTHDLPALCAQADIVIAAAGVPLMVKGHWIKPGACIIDVGINRVDAPDKGPDATRLVGDVDFEDVRQSAGAISPVPGGVGPMTIACLLQNTLEAAKSQRETRTSV